MIKRFLTYSSHSVITDLFEKSERDLVVSIFVIAIPLGSGLGFMAGSYMVKFATAMGWGGWEWSLRVTPPFGIICIILIVIIMPNSIPRGYSDGITIEGQKSSFKDDLKYLLGNKSFCSITAGKFF